MKDIIRVTVKTRKVEVDECKTDVICVGMFSDAARLTSEAALLDKKLKGAIRHVMKLGDFKGKEGATAVLYGTPAIGAKRVMLAGLGEKKKLTLDKLRKAAAIASKEAVGLKAKQLSLALHQGLPAKFEPERIGQVLAEGACFGSYRYDEFITKTENGRLKSLAVELVDNDAKALKELGRGAWTGLTIGQAQAFARTIANRPANVIDPPALASIAKDLAKTAPNLTCTIFDEKQLKANKMGGILAVGSGSKSEPRLIVLKYTPAKKSKAKPLTIGLVGKAITFDSGGLSIKPSSGMQDMKFDKSGGLAVLGAMKAISQLKPAATVYGLIPSAENMPSGTSYHPGDIITTFSGKTVEVQNTDAEGRIILCDAIHYAVTRKCDVIVDIATLTGACMVALGKYKAGLMGNDDSLIKQLQAASEESGEPLWHMPSGDEYAEEMKSKIADLKNIGSKWGGACTAAAFLAQFAGDTRWAHVDMAGVDMFEGGSNKEAGVGATGFGVRLLTTYVMNAAKQSG